MFKLLMLIAFAAAVAGPALAKPQVVLDYGYYAAAPAYVPSYSSPLSYSYSYPYAYAYSYPLAYY